MAVISPRPCPPTGRAASAVVLALFVAAPLIAQTPATGRVAGHVAGSSGTILAGATVVVTDAHASTVVNQRRYFQISGLAAGHHTLIAKYIGYAADTVAFDVTPGVTTDADLTMTSSPVAIAPLVVTGRVEGEARGLMERQSAVQIMDVATADVIRSRPDANIADAVGRLPGVALERDEGEGKYLQIRGTQPSFSNVTINGAHVPSPEGDTRTVKLDVIPASLVSEVQLNKTLTPAMDADAIGGSLNLVTRVPEAGRPVASLSVLGGHTDLRSNSAYTAGGALGGRLGAQQRLGVLLSGSYDKNDRPIDDVEPVFDTGPFGGGTVPVLSEVDQRLYSYERARSGAGGSLDYRLGDQSSLFLNTLYSDFHNYGVRYRADEALADGTMTPTSPTTGTATGGTMSRQVQTRRPAEQIFSISGGGDHVLRGLDLHYLTSYSHSQQRVVNGRNTSFELDNVDYSYDESDPKFPTATVTNGAPVTDPTAFAFNKFDIQNNLTTDREYAAQVSVGVPYQWGALPARFQAGLKLRDEAKRRVDSDSIYDGYGGSFTMADVLSGLDDPTFYKDRYRIGPVPSDTRANSFEDLNRGAFSYNSDDSHQATEASNYHGSEQVSAGYLMQSVQVGAWDLMGGLRLEHTRADYTANVVQLDSTGAYLGSTPQSGTHAYSDLFPSLQLHVAVGPRSNLRLAATEGIARPAFADLAPYLITSQGLNTLTEGNPALKPTHSVNFDVLLDHYSGSIGVASIGAYYKKVTDFIFTDRVLLTSGTYAGYQASQPRNGQSGHILGVELELQHRFTSIPGVLGGLGLSGNLNLADSRAEVPTGSGTRNATMPRQGKANANVELTYDRSAVSVRGGLTYNAKNIWEYGDDASTDVYLDDHLQFDANATVAVTPTLQVVVQALNITNEVFGFYQGSATTPIQREFYGRTLFLGARYTR